MKKNISILVLLGLLLAFGMLAASCDNGVLPKPGSNENQVDIELGTTTVTTPAATVAIDFFTTTAGVTSLGGDDKADGPTMVAADATALIATLWTKYMVDPADLQVYEVTLAAGTLTAGGTSIKATKGAAAPGNVPNIGPNGKL